MAKHPEQRDDEIFIQNATEADFNYSARETKRLGITSYDAMGNILADRKPLFVARAELLDDIGAEGVANFDNINDQFYAWNK